MNFNKFFILFLYFGSIIVATVIAQKHFGVLDATIFMSAIIVMWNSYVSYRKL